MLLDRSCISQLLSFCRQGNVTSAHQCNMTKSDFQTSVIKKEVGLSHSLFHHPSAEWWGLPRPTRGQSFNEDGRSMGPEWPCGRLHNQEYPGWFCCEKINFYCVKPQRSWDLFIITASIYLDKHNIKKYYILLVRHWVQTMYRIVNSWKNQVEYMLTEYLFNFNTWKIFWNDFYFLISLIIFLTNSIIWKVLMNLLKG